MKKPRLVHINWTDAITGASEEWTEPALLKNRPMPTKSVGWIIKEDKNAVTIAALMNDDHVGLTLTIPRRMIDEMRDL